MPPANSPSDTHHSPSFLLPSANAATGRTSTSPRHHSLPSHPDIPLGLGSSHEIRLSTIQRILAHNEGREDRQGGLDTGASRTGAAAGETRSATQASISRNGGEPYFFDARRPQIGSDNPLSRRLPPPSQTARSLQQGRQPYGSRPPRYTPGQPQDRYDWAPDFPAGLFDTDEMLLSRLPFPDTMAGMANSQFMARFQARNRQLQDEAESSSSSASGTPLTSNYQSLFGDNLDIRTHPSSHGPSERSTQMWNSFRELHRNRTRDSNTAWLESLRSQESNDPQPRTRLRRAHRRSDHRDRRNNPSGMDLDDPDMKDLAIMLTYISKLRSSRSTTESHRILQKCFPTFPINNSGRPDLDLLLDTRSLRIPESSFLQPGATFHGSQTTEPRQIPHRPPPGNLTAVSDWRVKVRITSIDYSTCALTGTMEAFGDWHLPSGEKRSISTYLEGELVDFKTHTLETFNFPSETIVDACYWSKLEPFSSLKDSSERRRAMLSKRWWKEEVTGKFILMRWKEREFIKDRKRANCEEAEEQTSEEQILTIRGFYYLSLRRRDGHVMGLYYDPESPPLQELLLEPGVVAFPRFEMR